jgi:hypothetical protein
MLATLLDVMQPRARLMRRRAWLRGLRWAIAALVLALVAPPATAAPSTTDAVVLVAPRAATASVSRTAFTEAEDPGARRRADPSSDTRDCAPEVDLPVRFRQALYLLDCALLR